MHPVLQMWMHSNFDWYNMINSTVANNKEDASGCLMMLRELINKGSVPYCGSNDDNSTGVSLSEILFSFMLEKYIVCDAWGLRSPSFESSSVLYITPTCTSSMQELTHWGRDKMAAFSQTTLSNAFSWMKIIEFRLEIHWSLFLRVLSTIFQHWFW